VHPRTRERILAIADRLGYRPNALARGLIVQRSSMIGLIMAGWTNPSYLFMLRRFTERLQQEGYQVMLLTSSSEEDTDTALQQLLQYQVEGVFIVSTQPSLPVARASIRAGTPVVLINRNWPSAELSTINCDNYDVGRQMAHTLVTAGYRRLALLQGDPALPPNVQRCEAIREVVAGTSGFRIVTDLARCLGYDAGRQIMQALWAADERADCVICSSDTTALGVLDGARFDLKLGVPDVFGIVGVGDSAQATWSAYQLTSVRFPVDEMIELAIDELLSRLNDPSQPPRSMTARATVVNRNTTRGPGQGSAHIPDKRWVTR